MACAWKRGCLLRHEEEAPAKLGQISIQAVKALPPLPSGGSRVHVKEGKIDGVHGIRRGRRECSAKIDCIFWREQSFAVVHRQNGAEGGLRAGSRLAKVQVRHTEVVSADRAETLAVFWVARFG